MRLRSCHCRVVRRWLIALFEQRHESHVHEWAERQILNGSIVLIVIPPVQNSSRPPLLFAGTAEPDAISLKRDWGRLNRFRIPNSVDGQA